MAYALPHFPLRRMAEEKSAGLPALMMAAERAAASLYGGDHAQRRAGGGEKFWQFRDYDPADRPQDIDWKQSAKGDRVFIRQKQHQTAQTILFWAQQDRGMSLRSGKLPYSKGESAVILALATAILNIRAGDRVRALDDATHTGRGENALHHLGAVLCHRPVPLPAGPLLPVAGHIPHPAALVLCGDFMARPDAIDAALGGLAARAPQGVLIQTLDPLESELNLNGRVIFRPFDDSRDIPVANVQSIREAYIERMHAHLATVRGLARRHGFRHIVHNTRDDIRDTLSTLWLTMEELRR